MNCGGKDGLVADFSGAEPSVTTGEIRKSKYYFSITAAFLSLKSLFAKLFILNGELAGIRTQDPRLKRALLYQLSYELTTYSYYVL
jgi:hypothetical protein